MKTVLVIPPWFCLQGKSEVFTPLGLASVAGALSKAGHEVVIVNGDAVLRRFIRPKRRVPLAFFHATREYVRLHDPSLRMWDVLARAILSHQPQVVGISMWTAAYQSALNVCHAIKKVSPCTTIVVGGIHPTVDPHSVIGKPDVDFIVCGEGERASVELWRMIEDGRDMKTRSTGVQGVWFTDAGVIQEGGQAPLCESLDDFPFPRYDLVDGGKPEFSVGGVATCGIMTSRGCPHGCTFCGSQALWTTRVRYRSIESCMRELEYYRDKLDVGYFRINDDYFGLQKERVLKFCDRLLRRFGPTWGFTVNTCLSTLDEEMVIALERAGCEQLNFGIESVVPRIRKAFVRKEVDLDKAVRMINFVRNRSTIRGAVYFMTGFPHETEEELLQNVTFMRETEPEFSSWSIVSPYPGTPLYNYARANGLLPDCSAIHLMHHSLETSMAQIPRERYAEILREILLLSDAIQKKQPNKPHRSLHMARLIRQRNQAVAQLDSVAGAAWWSLRFRSRKMARRLWHSLEERFADWK
jgi:anaerobic magnesium-protoporphyrin IX monomethyl ester cyclase